MPTGHCHRPGCGKLQLRPTATATNCNCVQPQLQLANCNCDQLELANCNCGQLQLRPTATAINCNCDQAQLRLTATVDGRPAADAGCMRHHWQQGMQCTRECAATDDVANTTFTTTIATATLPKYGILYHHCVPPAYSNSLHTLGTHCEDSAL